MNSEDGPGNLMRAVKMGKKMIGDGHSTFIIAEMAWSHDGSVENARKIIKAAAEAKADAVCFHITSIKDYMIPEYKTGKGRVSAGKESRPIYEYLSNINLSKNAWQELFPYAKRLGLLICTMCNDLPSVNFTSRLRPDAYIISPASLCEETLVREVARKKKPVFLRIGGAHLGEVEWAISIIKEAGNENIILIHGFQSYPTKLEDMHLRLIPTLKKAFLLPVGFADHTNGGSELALVVPLIALPFGANVIEKHLTHDRSFGGEDFESALDPDVFKKFVRNLRNIEKTFGSPFVRPLSKTELKYRQIARKRTVANKNMKKGEKLTKDKIAFKRSDEGVFPKEAKFLLGRTIKKDIKKNEPITWKKVL